MAGFKVWATSLLLAAFAIAHPHPGEGSLEKRLAIGTVIEKCTVAGVVALTFDDGPSVYTETLLDLLKTNNQKATFFVNGQNYDNINNYASTIQRMITEGHQVASHT
jgi:peptidoglycan/xylan/chitin deacetylase (PgdA/CDA1 family)